MKPACEVIVKDILPAMRALIARDLIEAHGMTQKEAARRLGMTQPAISQYKRYLRGQRAKMLEKTPFVVERMNIIVKGISSGEMNGRDATIEFCGICKDFRKKGMLCDLHIEAYPLMKNCDSCMD
jgi:predicted transcriptional regulator